MINHPTRWGLSNNCGILEYLAQSRPGFQNHSEQRLAFGGPSHGLRRFTKFFNIMSDRAGNPSRSACDARSLIGLYCRRRSETTATQFPVRSPISGSLIVFRIRAPTPMTEPGQTSHLRFEFPAFTFLASCLNQPAQLTGQRPYSVFFSKSGRLTAPS